MSPRDRDIPVDLLKTIKQGLTESAQTKYLLINQAEVIGRIVQAVVQTIKQGHKIVLFGNGGSAADAQHIAAELVGKFVRPRRRPLPALALTTNTSLITSLANDYGYHKSFSRQVEALVCKKDLVIALSTSGNSPNVLEAVKLARQMGAKTIGFTGRSGGCLKQIVHLWLPAPSQITARIQECHITVGHIICELVEKAF